MPPNPAEKGKEADRLAEEQGLEEERWFQPAEGRPSLSEQLCPCSCEGSSGQADHSVVGQFV